MHSHQYLPRITLTTFSQFLNRKTSQTYLLITKHALAGKPLLLYRYHSICTPFNPNYKGKTKFAAFLAWHYLTFFRKNHKHYFMNKLYFTSLRISLTTFVSQSLCLSSTAMACSLIKITRRRSVLAIPTSSQASFTSLAKLHFSRCRYPSICVAKPPSHNRN